MTHLPRPIWESTNVAGMRAASNPAGPVTTHAVGLLGGMSQVDEWEVALMHRDYHSGPGACVRTSWMRMGDAPRDRAVDIYRMGLLPEIASFEGFCSASFMIDLRGAYAVSSVSFDSRDAMELSRPQADLLRERGSREAGMDVVQVGEFELALAHLRLPELA